MQQIRQGIPFKDIIKEWNVPVLYAKQVHVWFADLFVKDNKLEIYHACLSKDEKSKAAFFIGKELQDKYIISHGILKLLLSAYSGVDPFDIELVNNDLGKPFWKGGTIHFNLTHSGNKCGIAFSRMHDVGLDVEKVRPLHGFEEMIQANFTTNEQLYINSKASGADERFFRLWTIKEAYLKATGMGMRLNPKMLDFTVKDNLITFNAIDQNLNFASWKFSSLDIPNGYKAAIAYHPEQELISPFNIN